MSDRFFGFDLQQKKVLQKELDELSTSVANLNAWATALATKLNAEAAGGVATFDTNYDTDPQA